MTAERLVCDQDVRDRVTTDLGTTYLLEAGAGTGKTRTLVDRCLAWLLDEREPGSLDQMLMVTFTEAAAAEIEALIVARREARAGKNFARADEIRKELNAMNVELNDKPDQTTEWTVKS